MIYIVGLGPGAKEYILPKAIDTLKKCKNIIGFSRAVDSIKNIENLKGSNFIIVETLKETLEKANLISKEKVAIIASGDPTFYGIANYIKKNSKEEVKIIPGISSFQYLSCTLGVSWNNAFVGSLHGREENFIEEVKNHDLSFWLTDKKNTPKVLSKKLIENGIACKITVGENLSYENERIITGVATDFLYMEFKDLLVIVIEKV